MEIAAIASRARPYSDPEELLPMCYRCSTYNPLSANTNSCVNCGQKFVHSFVSFELLPLVEFVLEDGISDDEAVRLIETPVVEKKEENWKEDIAENQQTLQLENVTEGEDPFASKVIRTDDATFVPVRVSRKALLSLESSSVMICKWRLPLKYQYYRNLLPDLHIAMCESCFKCYHVDDFELQLLQNGHCPFCRNAPDASSDSSDDIVV